MPEKRLKSSQCDNINHCSCNNCIRYILEDEKIITARVNRENLEIMQLFCGIDNPEIRKNIIKLLKKLQK